MFEVRGIPIFYDEVQLLKDLREDVAVKTGRQILAKIKPSGDNIMICCPIHSNGQERKPSCGVAMRKIHDMPAGTVHCFACGYIDSLEGMISKCFGYEGTEYGTNWLIQNYIGDGDEYTRQPIPIDITREHVKQEQKYITEEELSKYRFYHPYMFQRKLTEEVIQKYDIGYQKDYVYSDNWQPTEVITFPVRDINGNCLFVSRRSIHGKTFFLPQNIAKPVYGVYELPKPCNEVIICESVFNALTCVVYGKPAVALFGTGDAHQYEILKNLPVRKYILALDPDNAGEKGIQKIKKSIRNKILTRYIIPKGKDINDLSYEEFMKLYEVFL